MKKLYAIFDRIAAEIVSMRMYSLMAFRTDEEAARYFADAINEPTSMLHKHPGDYVLIHVGAVSDEGLITPITPAQQIITGDALLALTTQQTPELQLPDTNTPRKS